MFAITRLQNKTENWSWNRRYGATCEPDGTLKIRTEGEQHQRESDGCIINIYFMYFILVKKVKTDNCCQIGAVYAKY